MVAPASPTCSATGVASVTCVYFGPNGLKLTVTPTAGTLAKDTTWTFTINNVINPASTAPTSTFNSITGKDASGYLFGQVTTPAVIVTDITPGTPATIALV